ncbi:Protocadherin-8 Arcadlin [Triplophysa tibetana]|uniref:Protocadherin-8 Arcadlin n=1 Tax=Triplophysa tibetana TaxID=1572043 RepID=A0A5A9P3P6_9TELE|nr:Protocadherin-8 Arcadlin [Triplophysa tibetana]
MIVTTATLDRETISEYNLTVVAEDLGTPPFKTVTHYTIRITDENDNAPAFSKDIYDVSVIENNIPGSYITTVVARDLDTGKNGKVSYSLVEGKTPDGAALSTFVSIDPVSGSLYTLRSFNFEAFKQVQFTVKATDKGSLPLSSTALVRIHVVDANDNSPYFTYPVLRNHTADIPIPLNAQRGYLALRVTAQDEDDGDNSDLSFHILENDKQLFFMDKKSGEIILRQSLTASCGDVLQVRVSVVDDGREPLSSTATIRFVVTDTGSQEDQVVILLRSKEEETLSFDIGTVFIVAFTGGCVLLLTAVGILVVTCNRRRRRRNYGRDGLYGSSPCSKSDTVTSDIYGGSGAFLPNEGDSAHHCLYEDKSLDFEEKLFLPCKPFEQTFLWQDEKYCLQRSGTSNTDQLSVKDSGKGDSDFNDSDSDTSAAALKRSLTTFQPVNRSSFTCVGDWQGKQRVIQTQNIHVPPGAAYTIGFTAPVYNRSHVHSHPWKEGFNKTNSEGVIVEGSESDDEICGTGIESEAEEGTIGDCSEEMLDRPLIGTADKEEEQMSTGEADMWAEETSSGEGVLVTGSDAAPTKGPNPPRRNPIRSRHPPIKLSLETQVVLLESDHQKIERGRKLLLKARSKRSNRALHAP